MTSALVPSVVLLFGQFLLNASFQLCGGFQGLQLRSPVVLSLCV